IPLMALMITIGDLKQQAVNHAVGLGIPITINRNRFSYPAQRTDGANEGAKFVAEGAIFRFPANIDLNAYPATQWDGVGVKGLWRLFAEATRDYGMVIYDQSSVAVSLGEQPSPQYAQNPYIYDPIVSQIGITPEMACYHMVPDYPWDKLQLLPLNLP